jgi:hypothetical protein
VPPTQTNSPNLRENQKTQDKDKNTEAKGGDHAAFNWNKKDNERIKQRKNKRDEK